MGCDGGVLTRDNIEMLELLEEVLSYPPRFRLEFKATKSANNLRSQNVTVKFNGVTPPAKAIVTLEKSGISFLFCIYIFIFVILLIIKFTGTSGLPLPPSPPLSPESETDARSKGMIN